MILRGNNSIDIFKYVNFMLVCLIELYSKHKALGEYSFKVIP